MKPSCRISLSFYSSDGTSAIPQQLMVSVCVGCAPREYWDNTEDNTTTAIKGDERKAGQHKGRRNTETRSKEIVEVENVVVERMWVQQSKPLNQAKAVTKHTCNCGRTGQFAHEHRSPE
ncbi:hypothetical protein J6590_007122 [Homalodisca vitripennis]|nr:hypothetical protein J6590_007122 [Homalodisca vitripennis]